MDGLMTIDEMTRLGTSKINMWTDVKWQGRATSPVAILFRSDNKSASDIGGDGCKKTLVVFDHDSLRIRMHHVCMCTMSNDR